MLDLRDGPPLTRLSLRGDATVAQRAGAAFGVMPPMQPCQTATEGARTALWLGPDEWLLLAPHDATPSHDTLTAALNTALANLPHSLVDVSDGTTTLLVSGPPAELALRAGCPLDLHPSAFPTGMATRTVLARIGIILWRAAPAAWHIEVAPSLTAYAKSFLVEAARGTPASGLVVDR